MYKQNGFWDGVFGWLPNFVELVSESQTSEFCFGRHLERKHTENWVQDIFDTGFVTQMLNFCGKQVWRSSRCQTNVFFDDVFITQKPKRTPGQMVVFNVIWMRLRLERWATGRCIEVGFQARILGGKV